MRPLVSGHDSLHYSITELSEPETGLLCYLFRGVPDIITRYKVLLPRSVLEPPPGII